VSPQLVELAFEGLIRRTDAGVADELHGDLLLVVPGLGMAKSRLEKSSAGRGGGDDGGNRDGRGEGRRDQVCGPPADPASRLAPGRFRQRVEQLA
jgi:hypothetical protein